MTSDEDLSEDEFAGSILSDSLSDMFPDAKSENDRTHSYGAFSTISLLSYPPTDCLFAIPETHETPDLTPFPSSKSRSKEGNDTEDILDFLDNMVGIDDLIDEVLGAI